MALQLDNAIVLSSVPSGCVLWESYVTNRGVMVIFR